MKKFLALAGMMLAPFASASAADIVDIAAGNPDFSTLVTALKAAGLVETLKGAGPFTVFAPTNAAFAKVPNLDAILKDKAKLTAILTYHVVSGKVMAKDVVTMDGKMAKTVQGSSAKISVKGGTVMVDAAKVVKTDIEASNGVIHVIDSVIVPKM
jgi:uncharacterized surface protein with fasciclin (FAS1) repeats